MDWLAALAVAGDKGLMSRFPEPQQAMNSRQDHHGDQRHEGSRPQGVQLVILPTGAGKYQPFELTTCRPARPCWSRPKGNCWPRQVASGVQPRAAGRPLGLALAAHRHRHDHGGALGEVRASGRCANPDRHRGARP